MNLFQRALERLRHGQYRGDRAVARLDRILSTPAPRTIRSALPSVTVLDIPAPLASSPALVPVMADKEEVALA